MVLSTFGDAIEKATSFGQMCLAVSFDCSGAFDRIKFDSAEEAMDAIGVSKCITNWYKFILNIWIVKQQLYNVQGESCAVKPTRGSPQGGVLSPLVLNIIMNKLLRTFKSNKTVKVMGYADALLLYKGFHAHTMVQFMEMAPKHVLK